MEANRQNVTSFSKDGRYMHLDPQRASMNGVYLLLRSLGSSSCVFEIRYYSRGEYFTIKSTELLSDDPQDDVLFIENKAKELLTSDYVEIEKVVDYPQIMLPDIEYNI